MHHILNDIIKESGVSKAQFARDLDISRSYAIALLDGSRPLPKFLFEKLKTFDYVFEKHIAELSDMYLKLRHSDESIDLVKHFLEVGEAFRVEAEKVDIPEFNLCDNITDLDKNSIVGAACALLIEAIEKKYKIYTNYPFSFGELDEALYATYQNKYSHDFSVINHIVTFSDTVDEQGILSLWKSLRWGCLRVPAKIISQEPHALVNPYYIVSSDRLILFSFDSSRGTIIKSSSLADLYISEHKKIADNAHDLFYIIEDESQLLSRTEFVGTEFYLCYANLFCPVALTDYDLLYRNTTDIPHELKDILIKAFLNYYSNMGDVTNFLIPEKALEKFMKTGLVHIVSEKYLKPFSIDDRKIALESLIESVPIKLVRRKALDLPDGFSFELTDKYISIHFVLTYPGHTDYELYATIKRDTYHGLDDFLNTLAEYLTSSTMVLSDEQTKFKLKQLSLTGSLYQDFV